MAKKPKRRTKSSKKKSLVEKKQRDATRASGSTAEAVTVGWVLCLLTTAATELAGVLTRVLHTTYGSERLNMLSGLLLLAAAISGLFLLALTPVTVKLRNDPLPQPLIVAALLMGVVPLLTLAILLFR